MRKYISTFWILLITLSITIFSVCAEKSPQYVNSVGIKMILIPGGTFLMGEQQKYPIRDHDIASYFSPFEPQPHNQPE